jgi:hypothetical protein
VAFSAQFPTFKTPWQVPLLLSHIFDYRGDTTLSCLFHYGPAAAAYRYEGKYHGDAALQLFVSHHAGCDKGYENAVLKTGPYRRANGYFQDSGDDNTCIAIAITSCIADEDEDENRSRLK